MARTAIAVQSRNRNGNATISFAAADSSNGMSVVNDGQTRLLVKNASGSPITVTAKSVACSHGRTQDDVATIAGGAQQEMGPYDPGSFNQNGGVGGVLNVDFSASASVTVAAVSQK